MLTSSRKPSCSGTPGALKWSSRRVAHKSTADCDIAVQRNWHSSGRRELSGGSSGRAAMCHCTRRRRTTGASSGMMMGSLFWDKTVRPYPLLDKISPFLDKSGSVFIRSWIRLLSIFGFYYPFLDKSIIRSWIRTIHSCPGSDKNHHYIFQIAIIGVFSITAPVTLSE
jgi:hypothetical protein